MDDARRKRVEDLCQAALERKPHQRDAFLASACREDLELRQEVESLLRHNNTNCLLAEPPQVAADLVSEPVLSQLPVGARLGRYQIEAILGRGGMGEVYRARDAKLGRQVAIKVLPGHLAANAAARERLRREATAAAALDHPFICKVFEIGEEREVLFLVMEFIDGETLHQRLGSGGLPRPEALRFAVKWRKHWKKRTTRASCIATSSPPT